MSPFYVCVDTGTKWYQLGSADAGIMYMHITLCIKMIACVETGTILDPLGSW